MKNYVSYHNTEKMGYPCSTVCLSVATNKDVTKLKGKIWIISGEGKPRQYYLCQTFNISRVIYPCSHPDFDYEVIGSSGYVPQKQIQLNLQDWFPGFLKSQANFSFGFNLITDPKIVEHFETLLNNANPRRIIENDC